MSYVDLHCHLLPGVDDGARDLGQSLAHARRLVAEGVRDVTCTPHVNTIWPLEIESIAGRVAELQAAIDRERLRLRLHGGGELAHPMVARLSHRELELLAHGPRGARWLLLETPFAGVDDGFLAACRELRDHGFALLLAHPERAGAPIPELTELLGEELRLGALLQVNVCSLLGNHGLAAQETATALLRSGLAQVLASDGHPGTREHTLQLGFHLALKAGASSMQAWRLTQANPRFLLRHGIPALPTSAPATLTGGLVD